MLNHDRRVRGAAELHFIREIRQIVKRIDEIEVEDLTASLRAFQVTYPRDKIYGVLGMTRGDSITPDYHAKIEVVYTNLVESCLATGTLDLITIRRYSTDGSNLASRVPD
jgi:hypothetical protein